MKQLKIPVVDGEVRMRKLVKDFLQVKGFSVVEAVSREEAMGIFFTREDTALILLDVMMPKMDGWGICKVVRRYSQVPIIMLTIRSEERNELQGSNLGMDEHISKPLSPEILMTRAEAILRRNKVVSSSATGIGGIRINRAAHQVTIDSGPVDLSYKKFELLAYFVENQGLALSREKILNNVWNYDHSGDARTVNTHVKELCSELGDKGGYIRTIWGMGYKFEVEA